MNSFFVISMGTLFLIGTPIGNLQDITLRAIKTLFTVDIIACEDTRRAGVLLSSLTDIYTTLTGEEVISKPRLLSYYDQNEMRRIPEILSMLNDGMNIAVVSDAGMPAISDPGFRLVRECAQFGIKIEVIPGPSSVLTALVISGLPTDKFLFGGYPPHKEGHRIKFFQNLKQSQESVNTTVILFEAPHKLIHTLENMLSVFGDIPIVVTRELTKIHEEIRRETISASLNHFKKIAPKGEFVLLLHL